MIPLAEIQRKYAHVQGMTTRVNPEKGVLAARIHYTADPKKRDPAWVAQAKKGWASDIDWRLEMEIDRVRSGRAYYPPFAEHPKRYIARSPGILISAPVVRGWDFGGAHPACIWIQYSKTQRMVWALREILGVVIDTYAFRDLVRYLSGQIPIEELHKWPRAMESLEEIEGDSRYPPHPWIRPGVRFLDFAGHEGKMGSRGLAQAGQDQTATEILASGGIYLLAHYTHIKARRDVISGLANLRPCAYPEHGACIGHPGVLFDPACPILIEGVTGAIKFAKGTPAKPDPAEPQEDEYYSHPHDAFGYAVTNVISAEEVDWLPGTEQETPEALPTGDTEIETYLAWRE